MAIITNPYNEYLQYEEGLYDNYHSGPFKGDYGVARYYDYFGILPPVPQVQAQNNSGTAANDMNQEESQVTNIITTPPGTQSEIQNPNNGDENPINQDMKNQLTFSFDLKSGTEADDIYSGTSKENTLLFNIPKYGYVEYLKDLNKWQKQLVTTGAEPGWFFFKVFFNFYTNYGLLGGLESISKNTTPPFDESEEDLVTTQQELTKLKSTNTALSYLYNIRKKYKAVKPYDRMNALYKFVSTLKEVTEETPWIFKGIGGLDTLNQAYISDFEKNKEITLQLNSETADTRIGTMFDLYKYACYDSIGCKEVIPANLRKFEMTVLIFHMPISHMHDKIKVLDFENEGEITLDYREIRDASEANENLSKIDYDNIPSFKVFNFLNCEFDMQSIGSITPNSMTNESPFKMESGNIKIKFDRMYEHRMNEWTEILFGSDGFYYDNNIPNLYKALFSNELDHFGQNQKTTNNLFRKRMQVTHNDFARYASIHDYMLNKYQKDYRFPPIDSWYHGNFINDMKNMYNGYRNRVSNIGATWNNMVNGWRNLNNGPG